jgi:FkbM family methyltransferase
MLGLPRGVQKSLMPKRVKLPDGVKVLINDLATIHINIPDQYLRKEYEAMPDYVPSLGWIVADVGAYIGLYSLRVARIVGNEGFITAFEPNPNAYYWLLRNIGLNKAGNVRAYNVALADTENTSDFYIVTRGNIGASSLMRQHIKSSASGAESYVKTQIPVTTLDNIYYKSRVFDDKPINLVKIDVEGSELNVLRGSRKLLDENLIEKLIVEVHIDVVRSDAIERFLKKKGCKLDKRVRLNHVKEIHYYRG